MLKLFNSLTRQVEEFTPLDPPRVGMYSCGPTVYDYQHIGNYRRYIGDDILIRTLGVNGFKVKQVMNVTDVGHLTSDEDQGDDKLEKGAKERGLSVWETAKYFEEDFWKSMAALHVNPPDIVAHATDHIHAQIKLIEQLEKKGFTYLTDQAIYFDTSKFPEYGKLSGQKMEEKETGAREDVVTDSQKRNPADFALWFFTIGHFKEHVMRWSSPWGEGFPGWHIECSAMSMEYLGETLDIHSGGVDHLPIHHTNEIAQSEAATGKQFVRYWIHYEFLLVDSQKMSKSLKNTYRLKDLEERGFDPLAFRYLVLTAHYRDKLNFTWESLQAAQNALNNLREEVREWDVPNVIPSNEGIQKTDQSNLIGSPNGSGMTNGYLQKFMEALNNDLNTSQGLAVMWEMVKSDISSAGKAATLLEMDKVLGLGLDEYVGKKIEIPEEVQKLVDEREEARRNKNFQRSDELRDKIKELGYEIKDTPEGPKFSKG